MTLSIQRRRFFVLGAYETCMTYVPVYTADAFVFIDLLMHDTLRIQDIKASDLGKDSFTFVGILCWRLLDNNGWLSPFFIKFLLNVYTLCILPV